LLLSLRFLSLYLGHKISLRWMTCFLRTMQNLCENQYYKYSIIYGRLKRCASYPSKLSVLEQSNFPKHYYCSTCALSALLVVEYLHSRSPTTSYSLYFLCNLNFRIQQLLLIFLEMVWTSCNSSSIFGFHFLICAAGINNKMIAKYNLAQETNLMGILVKK
jgi:hypothetical protein